MSGPEPVRSERALIALVGAIQFVNVLEFMIVMPMGPDFARALGIPASELGLVGGSYTAAACVAGLAGSFFLDRFPRRSVLVATMAGLSLATLACALAVDLPTLLLARVAAGVFGGPATAVAIAIVTDAIPPERRGRAMGAVMGAFSAASVLGVPLGLELARLVDWRAPFLAVACLGLGTVSLARLLLPRLDAHLRDGPPPRPGLGALMRLVARREVLLAYALVLLTMFSGFLLIPNISALLQLNFGYPRDGLGTLYLVGGSVSFFVMRLAGRLVDRHGAARVLAAGALAVCLLVWGWAVVQTRAVPVLAVFVAFMASQSIRNVAQQTLTSRVPGPAERASFQSLQSAVQHAAGSIGAMGSSLLLAEIDGRLVGVDRLGWLAIACTVAAIPIAFALEHRLAPGTHLAPPVARPARDAG